MGTHYHITVAGEEYDVELLPEGNDYRIRVNDDWYDTGVERMGRGEAFMLLLNGQTHRVLGESTSAGDNVLVDGKRIPVVIETKQQRLRRELAAKSCKKKDGEQTITAPMAGQIVDVFVAVDEEVKKGQVLVIIEAMKMNNEIRALHDGLVKAVYVKKGDRVDPGSDLLVLV
ncbi:MAG TPA: biotin/lipoyl-containing protein [Dehalococcoidia bacterium]|nr:biotin/lipoyl-containing protein [Dehalococcoidia bacterium]